MAQQAAERREPDRDIELASTDEKIAQFLEELTRLSLRHGVGIAGKPILFMMESDDYERLYKIDDGSNLAFD